MLDAQTTSVSIRDLRVTYGTMHVLDGLNLDIAEGEFLVLLGSSGCGKSTLLNAIAGLNTVTAGKIMISGQDVTRAEPKDRGIGMVFQSYALYPRMTVAQNMGFGLKIRGMAKAEIAERVNHTAKFLQIEHLLKRRPADLSGGQRQRVAIGRALVRKADVFLFDEPLSNLDAQLRADLRIEIKRLHQSLGNTMIYVTHDQVEAMTLADRIAVMKDGKIQQLAPPAEVYTRPANLFVAGFLGTPKMNFIEGEISSGPQGPHFTTAGMSFDLDRISSAPLAFTGPATLGLRPEDFVLCPEGTAGSLEAEVTLIEPLGSETIIWATTANGTQLSLRLGSAQGQHLPALGTQVFLQPDLVRASLFDTQSGQRL
ncbi:MULTISPECIES: ABC transporter ATP-binding protein [Thioclava]|uniref:ABC transporter ATP-binding protein n=1 Tax=Thioclava kandeliae TaxID=3070818 RepID=A0ABV1SL08_9RHOB